MVSKWGQGDGLKPTGIGDPSRPKLLPDICVPSDGVSKRTGMDRPRDPSWSGNLNTCERMKVQARANANRKEPVPFPRKPAPKRPESCAIKVAEVPSSDNNPSFPNADSMTFEKEPVLVQIEVEKALKSFHRNLTDTFVIAMEKVKEKVTSTKEDTDEKMSAYSDFGDSITRKAFSQNIHIDSYPFNLSQSRAKKKKVAKEDRWTEDEETHLNEEHSQICIKKFGNNWSGLYMPGDGRSRGIIIVWKIEVMKVMLLYKCSQTVHVTISPKGGKPWLFTSIYASTSASERTTLWRFLKSLNIENIPWLLMGDFNCVEHQEDKKEDTGGFSEKIKRERRFIFELYWLENQGLPQYIKDNWGKTIQNSNKANPFMENLASLGRSLCN
ncbi:rRNA methyltransferase [Canna indica]|uniref:rRNA methyltransferase n=1 Tax=Canna indica TaxID=4628 RepID=A0AAQ3QF97_9LILI|nr:rRNA methyltransferase [Canna indica]